MDVFFRALMTRLHSEGHERQLLAHEWLDQRKRRQAEAEKLATKEAQEQIAHSIEALLEKVEQLERSVNALPKT
jgi:hypothetical protein